MAYHFFSRFPVGRSPGPLWRAIHWLLYAVFVLVIWPAFGIITFLGLGVSETATRFFVAHPTVYLTAARITSRPFYVYTVVCFVLSVVVTARNYWRLPDPDSRRRIKWVIAGVMIAIIPFVGMTFAFNLVYEWGSQQAYNTYSPLSFLTMLCIPASIGAAVWKQQLFDIRVLVRRGLQYVFARTALQAFLALPVALLALSILSNPNRTIAQILTQGSGGAYLIMELIAGRTWREELKRSGVIAPRRAAEWFRQLLEGLQFAHNLGVVHRDLKPENVMIVETTGGDELKIMDFGMAKVFAGETGVTESLTQAAAS